MVINRLGYKVSTIGLISKHGFMKLVSQLPAALEEVFVPRKKSVMISWALSSNPRKTEIVAYL